MLEPAPKVPRGSDLKSRWPTRLELATRIADGAGWGRGSPREERAAEMVEAIVDLYMAERCEVRGALAHLAVSCGFDSALGYIFLEDGGRAVRAYPNAPPDSVAGAVESMARLRRAWRDRRPQALALATLLLKVLSPPPQRQGPPARAPRRFDRWPFLASDLLREVDDRIYWTLAGGSAANDLDANGRRVVPLIVVPVVPAAIKMTFTGNDDADERALTQIGARAKAELTALRAVRRRIAAVERRQHAKARTGLIAEPGTPRLDDAPRRRNAAWLYLHWARGMTDSEIAEAYDLTSLNADGTVQRRGAQVRRGVRAAQADLDAFM